MSVAWTRTETPLCLQLILETQLCDAYAVRSAAQWTLFIGDEQHARPADWSEPKIRAALAHMLANRLRAAAKALEPEIRPLDNPDLV